MLEIKNLSFSYGEDKLFSSVNLSLHKGLICSLIGRSGAGKSTLFKLIAGQLSVPPDCLFIEGQDMGMLVPQQRPVVTMHQEGLLFPHLNVLENVLFGTRTKFNRLRFQGEDLEAYGLQLLEEMGLVNYGGKKVTQLSGGEVQRVALARALAVKPKVLLLDEPFSALNYQQRAELAALLAALVARHKIACVKITHDNEDALMADQIMLLQDGLATQSSTVNIVDERLNLYLGRAIIVDNAPVLLSELSLDHKCGRAIVCRILSVSSGHNLFIYRLEFQGQKFKYYTREFFKDELCLYLSASPR